MILAVNRDNELLRLERILALPLEGVAADDTLFGPAATPSSDTADDQNGSNGLSLPIARRSSSKR